jgi:LysM repeat protein
MTDRGLPIVDGAPACPFVAFEDDRDSRATNPDHRHRCYAEVRPAPRALAHQEAYCLSSAFPVCPTFQDWARREAAQAKAASSASAAAAAASGAGAGSAGSSSAATPPSAGPGAGFGGARGYDDDDAEFDDWSGRGSPGDALGRNPPRDWSAPPPWMSSRDDGEDEEPPEIVAQPPVRGGGLAGSFADRLAGGPPGHAAPAGHGATAGSPPDGSGPTASRRAAGPNDPDDEAAWDSHPAHAGTVAAPSRERRPSRDERRAAAPALPGPSWERPRRMEAYPTLKTRMGLPSLSLSPILLGVLALGLAAVAFFYLPTLLGIGNPPAANASPSPTAGASSDVTTAPSSPTPVPGPTQLVYLVAEGDTMSKIANRFSVPLQTLIDANKDTIPNPDVLEIGQEVIIPASAPTSLPDAGSPSPLP